MILFLKINDRIKDALKRQSSFTFNVTKKSWSYAMSYMCFNVDILIFFMLETDNIIIRMFC